MDDLLRNYSKLDIRHSYDLHTLNEEFETNRFSLADINSNCYDFSTILLDKCRHNNFQYKILHLNIIGLSFKCTHLKTYQT